VHSFLFIAIHVWRVGFLVSWFHTMKPRNQLSYLALPG
jgi:hypothetical protein